MSVTVVEVQVPGPQLQVSPRGLMVPAHGNELVALLLGSVFAHSHSGWPTALSKIAIGAIVWEHPQQNRFYATITFINDDMTRTMGAEGPTFGVVFGEPYNSTIHDDEIKEALRKGFWDYR